MMYVRIPGMREDLPRVPQTMAHLKVSDKGYPIPFFSAWINGKPDFRVINPQAIIDCVEHGLCWVCGTKLTTDATFVAGPLLALNQLSAEPPMHHECAVYAVQSCPFLLYPKAQRRTADLPEGNTTDYSPGKMIESNPGVSVLYRTGRYMAEPAENGMCFRAGPPLSVEWYAEGKPALRAVAMRALQARIEELDKIVGPDYENDPGLRLQVELMAKMAYSSLPKE